MRHIVVCGAITVSSGPRDIRARRIAGGCHVDMGPA